MAIKTARDGASCQRRRGRPINFRPPNEIVSCLAPPSARSGRSHQADDYDPSSVMRATKKKEEEEKCSCNGRYFKKPTPTVVYSATIPPDSFQYSRQCVLNMFFFYRGNSADFAWGCNCASGVSSFFKKINI